MPKKQSGKPIPPAAKAKARSARSQPASQQPDAEEPKAFAELRYFAEADPGLARECTQLPLIFPPARWRALEEAAMEWTYVLRSRQRWASSNTAPEEQVKRATDQLLSFGISPGYIQHIARARHVEVRMDARARDDFGWSIRIFPWEYVIADATRPYRHGESITVTRALEVAREPALPPARKAGVPSRRDLRVLYVESAPGELGKLFDFRGERELIDIYLTGTLPKENWKRLYSPTLDEFAQVVQAHQPHIVHLAGVDTHEGAIRQHFLDQEKRARGESTSGKQLVKAGANKASRDDGYLLAGADGKPCAVGPEKLADAITDRGTWHPWLVCMNLENSAPRVAPRAVQWGCHAAIGLQDAFDSALAELFFGTLYADLLKRWDLAAAFKEAWTQSSAAVGERGGSLVGTGVVLWTDTPEVGEQAVKRSAQQRKPKSQKWANPAKVDPEWIRSNVRIKVKPKSAINYSLLHNDGELFDEFSIKPATNVAARAANVRVTLSAGPESAEYACSIDLLGRPVDLRRQIKVSLGASLIRSVHEAINTTWLVEITWGAHVLLRETYPVRLLPIDQWRDALSGRSWLPSFVFPRDRAVGELVAKAADYVRVLRDDPTAGFEGYQCLPDLENPAPRDAFEVDLQVQAIWSTILYEWRLTYINPPPSYSTDLDSQRLRTPSMIARDRHGTCIDLALLLAACLELVDIWPVIFLLNDHAFPGYWRADVFHERFRAANPEEGAMREIMSANADSTSLGGAQRYPWAVGRVMSREIVREVRAGRLVPLETVRLTENCGFAEAIEAGIENFEDPERLEFLIDIAIARQHGITPLPLVGDPA